MINFHFLKGFCVAIRFVYELVSVPELKKGLPLKGSPAKGSINPLLYDNANHHGGVKVLKGKHVHSLRDGAKVQFVLI